MTTMASLADASPPIALGALDGRYRAAVAPLVDHLSEAALNRERVRVEVEWLLHLTNGQVVPNVRTLTAGEQTRLRAIVENFGPDDVAEIAEIERETVHDVKAVEYYLKRRLTMIGGDDGEGLTATSELTEPTGISAIGELVHFGCTSEDINNLSYALMVKGAVEQVWLPRATALVDAVAAMARDLRDVPLLAHTHGQPATPTTMGKELAVLAFRLRRQLARIDRAEYLGKLNGATGTYGAHVAAVPDADWPAISRAFVESLGLQWNPLTTQIESHDWQAELYSDVARFNRILHNLCTDVWTYISMGYFAQVRGQGTVGSSTMPHKVNPIRFENAEANLEVSNALLDVLASTLVQSRMQRDLTDSSMQRNIGTAFGHSLLAIDNAGRGLAGLDAVPAAMAADLEANWEVLGEPIQSAMRALGAQGVAGMENPYERLKELTRGRRITGEDLRGFVSGLGLPPEVEKRFLGMTPQTYVGLAPQLVDYLASGGALHAGGHGP
jgi:adenylosuccinate lyase